MADMTGEVVLDAVAVCQSSNFSSGHVHGGNDHDNVAAHRRNISNLQDSETRMRLIMNTLKKGVARGNIVRRVLSL